MMITSRFDFYSVLIDIYSEKIINIMPGSLFEKCDQLISLIDEKSRKLLNRFRGGIKGNYLKNDM